MDQASEAVLALKPVTFEYKSDSTGTPQFGLIAEEVAAVNPDLVVRDENGEIYTVRYEAVNAMLLNEFLKVHWKVEEQQRKMDAQDRKIGDQEAMITELTSMVTKREAAIAQQHKDFEARFNEQDAKIRKVSDQVEMSRPVPQMATNDQ